MQAVKPVEVLDVQHLDTSDPGNHIVLWFLCKIMYSRDKINLEDNRCKIEMETNLGLFPFPDYTCSLLSFLLKHLTIIVHHVKYLGFMP